eukprot:2445512-Rhodomonas_salina.1
MTKSSPPLPPFLLPSRPSPRHPSHPSSTASRSTFMPPCLIPSWRRRPELRRRLRRQRQHLG